MDLNPSISEGQINNNKPVSSKTSTKTQVIIRDGETIVIGGLIQKENQDKIKNTILFKCSGTKSISISRRSC